jgi:hypothetical protein
VFTCKCRFLYSPIRKMGDIESETGDQIFRYVSVKALGPVWERAFIERWSDPGIKLKKLALHFKISNISAKQQAIRLGIQLLKPGSPTRDELTSKRCLVLAEWRGYNLGRVLQNPLS